MKLVILAACLVAVALAQAGTDECDEKIFIKCTNKLGTFWSKDTSMIWQDLQYLQNTIRSLLITPYQINNYVYVCNGLSQFYQCLGEQQIRACLGTLGFVGSGMAPYQAYAYEGFLADWRFKCGAGFYAAAYNNDLSNCTQSTYVNYATEMQNCFGPYGQNTYNDPNNACTYAQTLMDCLGNVYGNVGPCRSTSDPSVARWYGCQSGREWTNAQFTHCRHVTKCENAA